MRYGSNLLLFALLLFPLTLPAQNDKSTTASGQEAVTSGRRLFQQHCSVCHTQPTLANPMYGPSLYRDLVSGREDAVRDYIDKGSSKMPGFRYGLKASDINAIIEYLKTVPKPAQRGPQTKGKGPVD